MSADAPDEASPTWRALWLETAQRLEPVFGDVARVEARWLCEEASGFERDEWLVALDRFASARSVARLDAMVERRLAGEPIAYVLGSWSFRSLDLMVDRRVLIPRPETEIVAEVALEMARSLTPPLVVADLGTGSGALGLSLAAELPVGRVEVWCTDVSEDALDVARANVAGLGRPGAAIRVVRGSWWEALPGELEGRLDLAVSNPPYVATGDEVDEAVRVWEPAGALFAGDDGLDAVRALVAGAATWLRPGGVLVVEVGAAHGLGAAALATAAGLRDVVVCPDLAGRDRVLVARR